MPLGQSQSVDGFIILTLAYRKEGGRWLGKCLELGTSTFGRTLKQVQAELDELVALHLNALEDAGECGRFFAEHGITYYTDHQPREVTSTIPVDEEIILRARRFPVPACA